MKIRKIWICSVLGAAVLAGAGCAQKQAGATVSQSAGKQETAERQKEAAEGMEPITLQRLKMAYIRSRWIQVRPCSGQRNVS